MAEKWGLVDGPPPQCIAAETEGKWVTVMCHSQMASVGMADWAAMFGHYGE
eukprot:symbB.v1.2.039360.t1/scaffold6506.1/size17521/1